VKKGVILAMGLAVGLALLAGCGNKGNKSSGAAAELKWKGAPYRLTLDTNASKPNQTGVAIPPIKYTANPEALEIRGILVIRFTASEGADQTQHLMIGNAVDIRGEEGTLPADYLDRASKSLSDYLGARCIQGKVKVSVALARSSVKPQADDAEVDARRLSDWMPFEVVAKKPRSKC